MFVDRDVCAVVLLVIKEELHNLAVVTMGLVFLNSYLQDGCCGVVS